MEKSSCVLFISSCCFAREPTLLFSENPHCVSCYYYFVNSSKDFLHNANKGGRNYYLQSATLNALLQVNRKQFLAWGLSSISVNFYCPTEEIFFCNSSKHLFTVKLFTQFMCKKLSFSALVNMCPLSWSLFLFYYVDYCWIVL